MIVPETGILKSLHRVSSGLNQACWSAAAVLMVLMLVSVLLQVIARYVFFSPPSWTEEFARYCMIWSGLLGATVTCYRQSDPVLVAAPEFRRTSNAVIAELLRTAAILAVAVPVLIYSPDVISHHMLRETESMRWTSGYVLLVVPFSFSIIFFHSLVRAATVLAGNSAVSRDDRPTD